jgi:hypothetical protein
MAEVDMNKLSAWERVILRRVLYMDWWYSKEYAE